jgi:hypothetical protein
MNVCVCVCVCIFKKNSNFDSMPFFHFEADEFFTNILFYDFCIDSIESL